MPVIPRVNQTPLWTYVLPSTIKGGAFFDVQSLCHYVLMTEKVLQPNLAHCSVGRLKVQRKNKSESQKCDSLALQDGLEPTTP